MNTPLINVDVLHNVTRFADFSAILQLTKTCHEFNAECAQYLLNDGVYLEDEESVESFRLFLTASGRDDCARRRFPFCTDIELSVGPSPSQSIKFALAALLSCIRTGAPHLTDLTIHDSNDLLAPNSLFPHVVAALSTIKELSLYEYGANCAAMLPVMQSRLLTVTLAHDESSSLQQSLNDAPPSPLNDPLYLLHRSQETLEFMDVTLPIMLRQGFYPNLVELRIDCPGWLPSAQTYICAFPRLVTLTRAVEFGIELTQERTPAAFACNQWNIAEQRRLGTWTSLREVQGSLEDLFLLGLTCPIPELEIDVFVAGLSEGDERSRNLAHAWRQVLGHARPSRVVLYVDDSDWISGNDGFALLSETPELVSLQSLDLTVRVGYIMGSNPDTLGEIDALDVLWVLANTFITPVELSVTFDWTEWSELAREFAARCPQYAEKNTDFPREHLDAVDMEGHVRRFVHEHTRSVRYCHVGPEGWRREATYFRADVSDEEHAAVI